MIVGYEFAMSERKHQIVGFARGTIVTFAGIAVIAKRVAAGYYLTSNPRITA